MKKSTIFFTILIIIILIVIFYFINKNSKNINKNINEFNDGVFDRNGNSINSNQKNKVCDVECLSPYPFGSQFYGYYYCKKNCAVFNKSFQVVYPKHNLTPNPPPPPKPLPVS